MNHIELAIQGMSCGSCVASVTRVLKHVGGVENVSVDLSAGRATITGALASAEPLLAAVQAAGYEASLAESNPAQPQPSAPKSGGCGSGRASGGGCCCR